VLVAVIMFVIVIMPVIMLVIVAMFVVMRMLVVMAVMVMLMVMTMIMFLPVIMVMSVMMIMRCYRWCVLRRFKCAGIRLKRRFNMQHFGAECFQRFFQRGIAGEADSLRLDFSSQSAPADVIGEPRKNARIGMARLGQKLWCGDDFDQLAIIHHQRIAAAKGSISWQRNFKLRSVYSGQWYIAFGSLAVIEHNGVACSGAPCAT